MTFSSLVFKQQFPLFNQPDNQQLVYLDNAATTHKPQAVIEAITHFYTHSNSNAQRSSHRLSRAATAMVDRVRKQASHFLGAASSSEIVFTRGATEGINLLASSLGERLQPNDEVLLSHAEHHANIVPWQQAARRFGFSVRFIEGNNNRIAANSLSEHLTPRTRILSLSIASNVLGSVVDIGNLQQQLADYAHKNTLTVIFDASQWAAHLPIEAASWPCDFLVCSAHKFYGPTGIGLLYGRDGCWDTLPPWQTGGEMVSDVTLSYSVFRSGPERFEPGTSSLSAIAGLEGCLNFWQVQDRAAMRDYEQLLNQQLHQRLRSIVQTQRALHLLTDDKHNVGIATLGVHEGAPLDLMALGNWLDEHDIAVRVGDHCAKVLATQIGFSKTLRFSLAAYNDEADIEKTINVIEEFLSMSAAIPLGAGANRAKSDIREIMLFSSLPWERLLSARAWQQRYKILLTIAEQVPVDNAIREDANRVNGCESAAWLSHHCLDGKHFFAMDSDSRLVKGLAALLLSRLEGRTTTEIMALDLYAAFVDIGLEKHLSPSRVNGFNALKERALALVSCYDL